MLARARRGAALVVTLGLAAVSPAAAAAAVLAGLCARELVGRHTDLAAWALLALSTGLIVDADAARRRERVVLVHALLSLALIVVT